MLGKPVSHELRTLKEHYSVFCARFNLKDCEFQRLIAGTDTRGIALNSFFNVYGDAEGGRSVFYEMTVSELAVTRSLRWFSEFLSGFVYIYRMSVIPALYAGPRAPG